MPFIKLPLGAVKPQGWLKDQLTVQKNGLSGHLDEFWPDLMYSAWKGGDGDSWERTPYYLDGLIPLAYLLEDEKLIKKVQTWVQAIVDSRQADGWFGPPKNDDRWPLAIAIKALTQYYEATNDRTVFDLIEGYFRYLSENPPDWPDSTWRGVRAMEHAVAGYWLFRYTKDTQITQTIKSIVTNSFDWTSYFEEFPWDSAAVGDGRVPHNWKSEGLTAHVVNNAMAIKYPGLWYQQSGNDRHRQAVSRAIENYDQHHGQVGGRFSGDEHLSGKRPTQGTELCAVVEYMFSLEKLIEIFGEPAFADRLELLAYNALPGTMTADGWAHQYDQQSNQVLVSHQEREWSTNGPASNIYGLMPNYPCCLANMHQGWPKLVQHLWMATEDQGLAAIVYGPSKVEAMVGNGHKVLITEETNYPFDGKILITITSDEPAEFPIHLRIPGWTRAGNIQFKGKSIDPTSGKFIRLCEKWENGDQIRLQFAMPVFTERRFNNSIAIRRGPLYFSLRIDKKYQRIKLKARSYRSIDYKGSADWEIYPTSDWNYGLLIDPDNPECDIVSKYLPLQKFPFADSGDIYYHSGKDRFEIWDKEAPVVLSIKGRQIPEWQTINHSAADPPRSPLVSDREIETLYLVPYGCTRLRISEFPVLIQ